TWVQMIALPVGQRANTVVCYMDQFIASHSLLTLQSCRRAQCGYGAMTLHDHGTPD
ncbi:MAG: hypothetical protein ACI82H_002326, partial [Alphaproteobacteria bacterium]